MKLVSLAVFALATAALAACVSTADPGVRLRSPQVPGPAPAPDVLWEQTQFTGAAGAQLYAQSWRPPEGTAIRGVLAIHHGLADHSDRYAPLGEQLARAGYTVWALDMRGHGRSSGARVSMDSIDVMLDDLDAFLRLVRERAPQKPLFLYGHSVGGLIAALFAIERQPALAGLILAAPGIAVEAPPLQAAAIQLVNTLASGAPILDTPHADFSSLPTVVADMDRDPLIHQGKGPARTARAVVDAIERVWAAPRRLRIPLLALHGDVDKLTAPSGSRDLVARAGTTDRTLRLYPGLAHDVMHEPASPQVIADLHAWLDAHTGGPAVTFASAPLTGPGSSLKGDARGRLLALELDLRGELPSDDAKDPALTAGLRLRLGLGRALAGLGYHAGLDLRAGTQEGANYEATAHLLGLALRGAAGSSLALTTGLSLGGPRGATATSAPLELSLEAPLGPARLLARTALAFRLGGDAYADDALGPAAEASALLGLRLFPDHHYWASTVAGAGPFLAVTYRNLGGASFWGLALGTQLWGGN